MSSGSPVVFKRTKSKISQRARESLPESHGDGQASESMEGQEASPSTLATKLKKKARAKPKSRLSFGAGEEEGEDDVFQIKKSNLSRKLALGRHPVSPGNVTPADVDVVGATSKPDGGPTYDSAYLAELKASTPASRPRVHQEESYDVSMSLDGNERADTSLGMIDTLADNDTFIPSESSIQAAKQKRERMRATGPEDDFISLSISKRSDMYQGPHPESRLVREEDELGEVEEEFAEYTSAQERIALGKKSKKLEAKKRRDEMKDMIEDAAEVDEETDEWEQEQLRRGGHRVVETSEPAKQVYKPAPIPPETPIPTLASAIGRLSQSLTALTTSHAQNTSSMASLSEERQQLEARDKEMREMITNAEAKRSWFVSFREWVESVATFLDEKYPELEKLEDEHVSLLRERRDMIAQRRRNDDEDDFSLFMGTLPMASQPQTEEYDELGRLVPKANPVAVRKERRSARVARRTRRASRSEGEDEGYSTDSSLPPSDAADYATALEGLSERIKDVLSDVRADEFRDPSLGLGKWFGQWRDRYIDTYTGAWGGLGMVGAWDFWVRLELVGWDPLEDSRTFDSFDWYTSLYDYSRTQGDEGDEMRELGPEGDLATAMLSTAVIPRFCKLVAGGGFDPYSTKHVRRMVDLAEQIEVVLKRGNLKFQMLLKAVFTSFQNEVSAAHALLTPYLALNGARFDPEAIPARRRVLARQSKLLDNILRWRRYTSELFGLGDLVTRLVRDCMLPIAESGWEVGGEEALRRVVERLPPELTPPSLSARLNR